MNKNRKETAQEPKVQEQLNLKFGKSELTIEPGQIHCKVRS